MNIQSVARKLLPLMLLTALSLGSSGTASCQREHQGSQQPPQSPAGVSDAIKVPSIPDVVVVDQDNRKLHFYRDLVQGRTVAINFIFTTCTTICPPLTANFAKIQKTMLQRGETSLKLISVSVDPENDTPERLKKYAELFGAKPGWTFVTGSRADMEQVWKAFGVYLSSRKDHPPTVAVGNDVTHVWNYASGLTSAGKLVGVIDATLQNNKEQGAGGEGSIDGKDHNRASQ